MKIKVTTRVDKTISDSLGNKTILNNSFEGKDTASTSPQGQEMIIDQADSKEWIVTSANGASFSKNIISLLGETNAAKVKFIHIECYKNFVKVGDIPAPIRFSLNWGGTAMGKMSQFQLANADALTAANITISGIEVTGTDQAVLQVVFALKQ